MRTLFGRFFCLALLLSSNAVRAETQETDSTGSDSTDQDKDQDLSSEFVIVEARRGDAQPGVRVIDSEALRREGILSMAQALERDVAIWGAYGTRGERLLTVRGFDQSQVAVFIDGIPTTVPYNGSIDLGKYPVGMLDEARVLPGASAGIHGPSGLGGALDLRTLPAPYTPLSRARLRSALHGAVEAEGSVGGPVGPVRLLLSGGGISRAGFPMSSSFEPVDREDGGIRDHSDDRSQNVLGKANWDLGSAGQVQGTAHYITGDHGVPTATSGYPPRYWRFTEFKDLGASLSHQVAGTRLSGQESLFFTWNRNLLDAYDDASRTSQEYGNSWHSLYKDQQVGGTAGLGALLGSPKKPFALVRGRVYGNHQRHRSIPDRGEPLEEISTNLVSGALTAEGLVKRLPRPFLGIEVDAELPDQNTGLQAAPPFVGPVFGLGWAWKERLDLMASVARRARFPTLKERFSSHRGYSVPSLDLGAETAWHAGLDAAIRPNRRLDLVLSAYNAEVQDLIEEVDLASGEVQLQNTGRARFMGLDAIVRFKPWSILEFEAAGSTLKSQHLDRDPPQDRVEYHPAWQALFGGTLRPLDQLELGAVFQAVGPQYFFDEDQMLWGTLGAFSTVDANLGWRVSPRARLSVQVRNLLDVDVQSKVGYPDPGREIWLSMDIGS